MRVIILMALLAIAIPAYSAAPPPAKPVAISFYSGRWFEIARTPNARQRDCEGPTSDFETLAPGTYGVVETCHQGAPAGPAKTLKAKAKILDGSQNARFRMAFFGGLVHAEFWILDHADDGAWAIMATPGGNYAWLLARKPQLPPAVRAAALARLGQLGYQRLMFPQQAPS
jgi:apolipoprotein D and lipocalin family protein